MTSGAKRGQTGASMGGRVPSRKKRLTKAQREARDLREQQRRVAPEETEARARARTALGVPVVPAYDCGEQERAEAILDADLWDHYAFPGPYALPRMDLLAAHDEALRSEVEALRAEVERLTAERDALRVSRDATFVQLGHAMRVIRDQISEADAQNAADYEVRLAGLRSLNDLRAAEARVAALTRLLERAKSFVPDRAQALQSEIRAVLGETS